MEQVNGYSINDVIENLKNEKVPLKTEFLRTFSDITADDLDLIKSVWAHLSTDRKINLLQHLLALMESDTLISCDEFSIYALEDEDPQVKSHAISLLWENSDLKLIPTFLDLLTNNTNPVVNAAAAIALGKFILLGELEEIPSETAMAVRNALLVKYESTANDFTKQKALESLGYIVGEKVNAMIKNAIKNPTKSWQLSALVAIARSANEDWDKDVVKKLNDTDQDILIEAIKAAGELEITSAKERIIEILDEFSSDEEAHLQAILALSKIGGRDVRQIFTELLETSESEEETDLLEIALENMDLSDGIITFDFFSDEQ